MTVANRNRATDRMPLSGWLWPAYRSVKRAAPGIVAVCAMATFWAFCFAVLFYGVSR